MQKGDSFTFEKLNLLVREIVTLNPSICVSDLVYEILDTIAQKSGINKQSISHQFLPDDITILGLEIEDETNWEQKTLKPDSLADINKSIIDLYNKLLEELNHRDFNIPDICIRSVLTESVMNAWNHGNKREGSKSIGIRWRFGNDFYLMVCDEGEGFEFQTDYDPKSRENLTKSSGRGLFIIRRFSDEVRWEGGGNCIIMTIRKKRDMIDQVERKTNERLIELW